MSFTTTYQTHPSPDEQLRLARRVQAGDKAARNELVERNMTLVVSMANKFYRGGSLKNPVLDLEDFINEGAIGLIRAAELFDPDKNVTFSTYATYWIRQASMRLIDNSSKAIRLPVHVAEKRRQIRAAVKVLGEDASVAEIGSYLGHDAKWVEDVLITDVEVLSLDAPLGDEENSNLFEFIKDEHNPSPEEQLLDYAETEDSQFIIDRVLSTYLTEVEAEIYSLYHPENPEDKLTLEEIGYEYGLTRERVRQILQDDIASKLQKAVAIIKKEAKENDRA
jgi:RNA polymerase primary sigma factor